MPTPPSPQPSASIPPQKEGLHQIGGEFVAVLMEDGQSVSKTFPSEEKAASWLSGVLELRKNRLLGPLLKGVHAAVERNAKTVATCKMIESNHLSQVGLKNFYNFKHVQISMEVLIIEKVLLLGVLNWSLYIRYIHL